MTTQRHENITQPHTCIQCDYCDMLDMTCANIDNADKDNNRMPILSDTPACKHFTPEK